MLKNKKTYLIGIVMVAVALIGWFFTGQFRIGLQLGNVAPPAINIDGKLVEFPYSDENANEDLIIFSNSKDYYGFGYATMYFAVKNISGKSQNVDLAFSFKDNDKRQLVSLERYAGNHTEIVPASVDLADDLSEITIPAHEITKTDWIKNTSEKKSINWVGNRKDVKGMVSDKFLTQAIAKDEVIYFKAKIKFPTDPNGDEFFIEAFGDQGAYGHLDPTNWSGVDSVDYTNATAIVGQTGLGTGWQNDWLSNTSWLGNTSVKTEGAGSGYTTGATANIYRTLTTASDEGILKVWLMRTDNTTGDFLFGIREGGPDGAGRGFIDMDGDDVGTPDITVCDNALGGCQVIVSNYSNNTWYLIHLGWNAADDTLRGREDSSSTWTSNVATAAFTNINELRILTSGAGYTGNSHFDGIGVGAESPTPPAAPEQPQQSFIPWTEF